LFIGASFLFNIIGGTSGFLPNIDNFDDRTNRFLLQPHELIFIEGNNDFTEVNGVTSGDGSSGDPYVIENFNIKVSISDMLYGNNGIMIRNTNAYFIIRDCWIHFISPRLAGLICNRLGQSKEWEWDGIGIYLDNVSNGIIDNCLITGMNGSIYVEDYSHDNIVRNCTAFWNYCGIGVNLYSYNNTIENCTTFNTGCGICIYDFAHHNLIKDCKCYWEGYHIFYYTHHNTILRCTAAYCNERPGFRIDKSYNNTIKYCNIFRNDKGIVIRENSDDNLIYYNNFFNNLIQASDSGNNKWDNGSVGNFWSDYEKRYPDAKMMA
jgi:parallel beta-helix repeat protein